MDFSTLQTLKSPRFCLAENLVQEFSDSYLSPARANRGTIPRELDDRVWHRGLDNNRTQLLAALFAYQLLVRYNHRRGHKNGQIH